MQRYQCHKIVEAGKIVSVAGNRVWMKQSDPIDVPDDWLSRFKPDSPDDLGYFVRYEDGYESWSPSKAFEAGYTLVPREAAPPAEEAIHGR